MDDGSPGHNIMTNLIMIDRKYNPDSNKVNMYVCKCKFNLEDTTSLISKNNFKFDAFSLCLSSEKFLAVADIRLSLCKVES